MTMFAAKIDQTGSADDLYIGEVEIPVIKESEILIEVYATAVNRADILQRKGQYPPPPGKSEILGLEASGIVHSVGSQVTKWKIGERVMALCNGGGYAQYVAVDENHVMPIPEKFDFVLSAAIPEVWLTAFQLLHTLGELKSGETVLIHAAASGVGTAALQLAKLVKAVAIATAGTKEKLSKCKLNGATHVICYKTQDFSEEVLKLTNGKGVDLLLDCVGGSYWQQNIKSLAKDGRWVLYGLLGGPSVNGNLFGLLLAKRVKLIASTLRSRSDEYKSELVEKFSTSVLDHFINGDIQPVVDSVFSFKEELSAAQQKMEDNKNVGKIVLKVKDH